MSLPSRLCRFLLAGSLYGSVAWSAPTQPPLSASVTPDRLRCEYRVDPLGIDSANPRLDWIWQARDAMTRGLAQSAYQILVASSPESLARNAGDLWDSGKVASAQMNQIAYAGQPLLSDQRVWWKVKVWDQRGTPSNWSPGAQWTMGVLTEAGWHSAKWIAAPTADQPTDHKGPLSKYETVLLRREFVVKPGLKLAIVNVCGLGQYAMTLDGAKVSQDLLSPGWTLYNKTCLFDTYDITPSLRTGTNAIGLFLGNGFYNIHGGRYSKIQRSFGPVQAIALIRLEYADGTIENVVTDQQWKASSGPITFSSIYGGEDFDARLAQDGWDQPGFNDSLWEQPKITVGPGGLLKGLSCAGPPIRRFDVLTPVRRQQLGPGVCVYDLGQNAALMLHLTVKGSAGATVKVIPSETIDAQGDIQDDMCGGNSYWTYILSGNGDEDYVSRFYYRGGRYLKVELQAAPGSTSLPNIETIAGDTIHANAAVVGHFSCSNDRLNKIYTLVRWAQLNNMMSVLTDCPTREKLGWLEEDHLNGPALRDNFALSTLFAKCLNDMSDSQRTDGMVPATCPDYPRWTGKYANPPEWGSACIEVPWQQYIFDADVELLRQRFEMMKRYVSFLSAHAKDNIVEMGLGDWYDNHGFGEPHLTPVALTASAFYYDDVNTLGKVAALLGRLDDAATYRQLAARIGKSFNQKFFDPSTHRYATGSQASYAVPLALGLVEPAALPAVSNDLVADRDLRNKNTTVGEVCLEFLFQALAESGHSDLLYAMYNTDESGYGLQVKLGKTALTEAWNGDLNAFKHHSDDHFMFGQINEWFFSQLAGIQADPAGPGFKKIIIQPAVVGDLAVVTASYDGISGQIVSEWTRHEQNLLLHVVIPPNATATVAVPASNPEAVREGGQPAAQASGVKFLKMDIGAGPPAAVYEVGSGDYTFASTLPRTALAPNF